MDGTDGTDALAIQTSLSQPDAFVAIFERHFDVIARYLRRRVDPVLADELAAQVFVVAFSRRESYDSTQADARPWLYGIAASLLRGHARAEERELRALARTCVDPLRLSSARAPAGDEALPGAALEPELARVLAELAPQDREVLLLHAWGELGDEEIADALGLPVGTVKSRLDRARRRVREAIARISALGEEASHG
jgi:RNA polymerase sigma factor (sigma-70 family)